MSIIDTTQAEFEFSEHFKRHYKEAVERVSRAYRQKSNATYGYKDSDIVADKTLSHWKRIGDILTHEDLLGLIENEEVLEEHACSNAKIAVRRQQEAVFNDLWCQDDAPTTSFGIKCGAAVLRRAKRILMKDRIRPGGEDVIMCGPRFLEGLLSETEVTSADYEAFRALVDANLDEKIAFGFRWQVVEDRGNYRSDSYQAVAYDKFDVRILTTPPVNTIRYSASKGKYVINTAWWEEIRIASTDRIVRLI